MPVLTDAPINLDPSLDNDPILRRQGQRRRINPVVLSPGRMNTAWEPDLSDDTGINRSEAPRKRFVVPAATAAIPRDVAADSIPLQIWEGTVLEVDRAAGVMQVLLSAKIGEIPRHTGEVELEWVSDQDQDLVRPGAVFYLTLFKRTKHGSVENAQELRFRRRPSWSALQLKQVEQDADLLLSKLKALPYSE